MSLCTNSKALEVWVKNRGCGLKYVMATCKRNKSEKSSISNHPLDLNKLIQFNWFLRGRKKRQQRNSCHRKARFLSAI